MTGPVLPGEPFPLGASPGEGGTNFAVASRADAVQLCLFDDEGAEVRIALPECDAGIWHGFVRGVGPGQAYGCRASGPWDPGRGLRYNPAKLLLDPYARALDGEVRFGPEVLGHDPGDPARPSSSDLGLKRTNTDICAAELRKARDNNASRPSPRQPETDGCSRRSAVADPRRSGSG